MLFDTSPSEGFFSVAGTSPRKWKLLVGTATYEVWFYPLSSRILAIKEGYSPAGLPFSRLRSFSLKNFRMANSPDIKVSLWLKQVCKEIDELCRQESF